MWNNNDLVNICHLIIDKLNSYNLLEYLIKALLAEIFIGPFIK